MRYHKIIWKGKWDCWLNISFQMRQTEPKLIFLLVTLHKFMLIWPPISMVHSLIEWPARPVDLARSCFDCDKTEMFQALKI